MAKKQIYYKSDFSAILSFDGGWKTPFKLKFWTNSPSRVFTASYDGATYTNCEVTTDDRLLVAFNSHNMGFGVLMMQPEFYLSAQEYADGVCNEVITPFAPVFVDDDNIEYMLALGLTGSSTIEVVGTLPCYFKSNYELAVEAGFTGTLDDWLKTGFAVDLVNEATQITSDYLTAVNNATSGINTKIEKNREVLQAEIDDNESDIETLNTDVDTINAELKKKYEKPLAGIPLSDLSADVRTTISNAGKADEVTLTKNSETSEISVKDGGVTKAKVAGDVKVSLLLADSAVQPSDIADMETKTEAAEVYATKVELAEEVAKLTGLSSSNFMGIFDTVELAEAAYSGSVGWALVGSDLAVLTAYRIDSTDSATQIGTNTYDFTDYSQAIKYVEQTLTDEQQAQARTNIGSASASDVSDLSAELDTKASAEYLHTDESLEFTEVLLDADNKVLESRTTDGTKTVFTDTVFSGKATLNETEVKGALTINDSITAHERTIDSVEEKATLFVDVKVDGEGKVIEGTRPDGKKYFAAGIDSPTIDELESKINSSSGIDYTDVVSRNGGSAKIVSDFAAISMGWRGDDVWLDKSGNILPYYNGDEDDEHKKTDNCITPTGNFIYATDLHGAANNMSNINKVQAILSESGYSLQDVIMGGDQAESTYLDGIDSLGIDDKCIFVVGNHDVWTRTDNHPDYDMITAPVTYDQYFKDRIGNWGVISPEDAATAGKCYFYKDYTVKGRYESKSYKQPTYKFRVIFIDCMHAVNYTKTTDEETGETSYSHSIETEQLKWFCDILDDARKNSIPVMCVSHYAPAEVNKIDCNWTCIDHGTKDHYISEYVQAVDYFIRGVDRNGEADELGEGRFIMWLGGHVHYDVVGTVSVKNGYEQPIFLSAAASDGVRSDDLTAVADSVSQDCFNFVSIDFWKKVIKVHRFGRNVSRYGQVRNNVAIDYSDNTNIKVLTD